MLSSFYGCYSQDEPVYLNDVKEIFTTSSGSLLTSSSKNGAIENSFRASFDLPVNLIAQSWWQRCALPLPVEKDSFESIFKIEKELMSGANSRNLNPKASFPQENREKEAWKSGQKKSSSEKKSL